MRTGVSPKRIATGNLFTKGILKGILPLLSHLEVEMRLSMPLLFGTVSNFPTGEFSTDTMFSPKNRVGLNSIYQPLLLLSLERRWSSRTFRYGYLVTTSPQLSVPPSAALSLRLSHWLRALLTPMVWRAVCTRPGNVFTATFWFAITSDSSFM